MALDRNRLNLRDFAWLEPAVPSHLRDELLDHPQDELMVYPANAVDSWLRGEKVPLVRIWKPLSRFCLVNPLTALLSSSIVLKLFFNSYYNTSFSNKTKQEKKQIEEEEEREKEVLKTFFERNYYATVHTVAPFPSCSPKTISSLSRRTPLVVKSSFKAARKKLDRADTGLHGQRIGLPLVWAWSKKSTVSSRFRKTQNFGYRMFLTSGCVPIVCVLVKSGCTQTFKGHLSKKNLMSWSSGWCVLEDSIGILRQFILRNTSLLYTIFPFKSPQQWNWS